MGNIDSKRDWGHAIDYVKMHWLMLQQENPEDFVIATGRMETVRKFIEISAGFLVGTKRRKSYNLGRRRVNEIGRRADNGKIV